MLSRIAIIITLTLGLPLPTLAAPINVGLPLECKFGIDCFIQKYVDQDPAEGQVIDYRCGSMASDNHKGTDFRLRDYVAMERGYNVVAAADGTVSALRDGMEDVSVAVIGEEAIRDRECGNGVMVEHTDGYKTQYCHLKKGSIVVKKGDKLTKGQKIGQVGLSGSTEYPHVHMTLYKANQVIDPFTGLAMGGKCNDPTEANLWDQDTNALFTRFPENTYVLTSGFAPIVPKPDDASYGKYNNIPVAPDSNMFIYWSNTMGLQPGDVLHMKITAPDHQVLVEHQETIPKSKAQFFKYIGKKLGDTIWHAGEYRGEVTVTRQGKVVASGQQSTTVVNGLAH